MGRGHKFRQVQQEEGQICEQDEDVGCEEGELGEGRGWEGGGGGVGLCGGVQGGGGSWGEEGGGCGGGEGEGDRGDWAGEGMCLCLWGWG